MSNHKATKASSKFIFDPEWDNTFFCVTSSFLVFPGLPLYASKDLQNWELISNVFDRQNQVPQIGADTGQNNGLFALTLRYHDGTFYVIVEYITVADLPEGFDLVFTSTNPYGPSSFSDPVFFRKPALILDPDLFWDDNGTLYVQAGSFLQNIVQFRLDLATGITSPERVIWEGTGSTAPEGPHMYKKDGWYYLLISEGGTALPHCITIARSQSPSGPFQGCAGNPLLTNRGTEEYFQTVGHADLFQDGSGNWWGVALATRSGPEYVNYPMGRETVLFPATWNAGDWPTLEPALCRRYDSVDFAPGSGLPTNFVHWKFPPKNSFTISPPQYPNMLRITPSKVNFLVPAGTALSDCIASIARRQTATLFNFSVDIWFEPTVEGEEVGVTIFLTQLQHINLGLVMLPVEESHTLHSSSNLRNVFPHLRFRTTTVDTKNGSRQTNSVAIPEHWRNKPLRLHIQAHNELEYIFSATLVQSDSQERIIMGTAPASIVSGDSGHWTGSLVGVYATTNGGSGSAEAYVARWRYEDQRQYIGNGEWV
ncbi:related to xylosidase : arabinofuranosidase [Phialocephala subalpina]|uniref:Related to xylosidase: arabinofuranosidase n=1 Tax=Phialocephala subalpina TaxID=576137 RepID=A0A1L7WT05_9HELO|nr:related to xylosidase : arabinofuranosidase [Phialocephala subalpina]